MSRHEGRHWRERESLRYLDALDAGDLDAVAAIWEEAAADPELEALLRDLDEGLFDGGRPGGRFPGRRRPGRRHWPGAAFRPPSRRRSRPAR